MAYRVTFTLERLPEPISALAESPEKAAAIAWKLCEQHKLDLPNESWMVNWWDPLTGASVEMSTYDCMMRGTEKYPKKTNFRVFVVDKLSKRGNNNRFLLPNMMPEPMAAQNKFETFRGKQDRLSIVPIACKIDEAMGKITDEQEGEALVIMLETKLEKARVRLTEMKRAS